MVRVEVVAVREVELRCAYCHDQLDRPEHRCRCGAVLHQECASSLAACPILGCRGPARVVQPRPDWVACALLFLAALIPGAIVAPIGLVLGWVLEDFGSMIKFGLVNLLALFALLFWQVPARRALMSLLGGLALMFGAALWCGLDHPLIALGPVK